MSMKTLMLMEGHEERLGSLNNLGLKYRHLKGKLHLIFMDYKTAN